MTSVDAVLGRLLTLAATATHHAAARHQQQLNDDAAAIAVVDALLTVERDHGDRDDIGSVVACYGAWFGEWLVRHRQAQWIALHESFAPRIKIGLLVFSPMDLVARYITKKDTLTLADCLARLDLPTVISVPAHQTATIAQWNNLANDPRFIADDVPCDSETARAMLDPWLAELSYEGKHVCCLGAGGGRHAPLFARLGAQVTVVDIAEKQLAIDQRLAKQYSLPIITIQSGVDQLSQLADQQFSVVVQPVVSCYVPQLADVHKSIARILFPGGLYVVQHKHPASAQLSATSPWKTTVPYNDGQMLPYVAGYNHRETGTVEYLHTLDALIGDLCRAGFAIEDLSEPRMADYFAPPDSAEERAVHVPPYLKIKARRREL